MMRSLLLGLVGAGSMAAVQPAAAQPAPAFAILKCVQDASVPKSEFSLMFRVSPGPTMVAFQPAGNAKFPFPGPQMFKQAELTRTSGTDGSPSSAYVLKGINEGYEFRAQFTVEPGRIQAFMLALGEGKDPDVEIMQCDFVGYSAAQTGK